MAGHRKAKGWKVDTEPIGNKVRKQELEIRKAICEIVQDRRKELHLSIEDISVETGLTIDSIRKVLDPSASSRVPLDVLIAVCEVCQLKMHVGIGGPDSWITISEDAPYSCENNS